MCWEPRCHFEFSYPSLIRTARGEFHLLYTWNRAYIKHVRFNQAWLDERLASASHAASD
jgi:predicted neuraminidase